MFSFGRTPDEREAPGTPPAPAGGEHGAGTDGAGAPRPELSPAFGRIDVPRDVRPLRAAASLDGISAASTSGAPLNRDGYPEGNLDGRPEPHPDVPVDVPVDDPFSAIDAPPPAKRAMLWAPPAFLTGVILVSALGVSARSSGAWTVLVPALVWVACAVTSFPLARTLVSPDVRPRRWDAWVRRMRPRALDSLDRVAPESGHRAGPMVAAALAGFAVLTAATAVGRWLASAADVHAGPAAWLGNALGVVGALGLGLFAGALSALGSGYLLVGYVAFWSWRRRVALRAVPDAAAAWLMRHAAHLLAYPWDPATQADRRRRVRYQLRFAAAVLPRGASTPELRDTRREVAAALRTLADAVHNTGDPERERVRRALLEAEPAVVAGAAEAALEILQPAAEARGANVRQALSARSARRSQTWSPALVRLLALGVVGVLGALLVWAIWHDAVALPAAVGADGDRPSTAVGVLGHVAADIAKACARWVLPLAGTRWLAPKLLNALRAWEPTARWLRAVRRVAIQLLAAVVERERGAGGTARVTATAGAETAPSTAAPPPPAPPRRAARDRRRRRRADH